MSGRSPRLRVALLAACAFAGLSYAAHEARRAFVRAVVLRDGPVPVDMSLVPSSGGVPRAAKVRVVLLDGLAAATAEGMPGVSAVCAAGRELRVDVGFPTVSLAVQSVLWTGLTQQQSGLYYRAKQLEAPLSGSIAGQVAGSVAIAESHPEIVRSFGFSRVLPGEAEDAEAWRGAFPDAAVMAVASSAPLVHVHVLRIDEAGHASGGASEAYASAAAWSDQLLDRMRAVGPRDALWLVLADHGHTPAGGHGGEAPEIRIVRACLAGPGISVGDAVGRIHLVDVARILADALGVELPAEARGRALPAALAEPAADATLPGPGPGRVAAALLVLALAFALGVVAGRSKGTGLIGRLPWAALAGLVGVAVWVGWPSLSDQSVFAPKGLHLWLGCLPGALVMLALGLGRGGPGRSAVGQLVPALGLLLAALVLCRAPEAWVLPALGWGEPGPPLMPRWTATASVLFVLVRALCDAAALAWFLAGLRASGLTRLWRPGY